MYVLKGKGMVGGKQALRNNEKKVIKQYHIFKLKGE